MPVTVCLLGDFAVQVDGRPIAADRFPRRAAVRLVQLLALAPARRLHREQVMDALWPDTASLDVAEAARGLDVPTLILHSRDDLVWSFTEAEELHAMIAGSRLVGLDSRNHILQAGEPAFAAFLDELRRFLAVG